MWYPDNLLDRSRGVRKVTPRNMVLDKEGKTKGEKIEVEGNECIDVGALTQVSGLDSVAQVPRSVFISLLSWLTKD